MIPLKLMTNHFPPPSRHPVFSQESDGLDGSGNTVPRRRHAKDARSWYVFSITIIPFVVFILIYLPSYSPSLSFFVPFPFDDSGLFTLLTPHSDSPSPVDPETKEEFKEFQKKKSQGGIAGSGPAPMDPANMLSKFDPAAWLAGAPAAAPAPPALAPVSAKSGKANRSK